MDIETNVSKADQIVRGVVGIWLLAMSIGALLDRRRVVGPSRVSRDSVFSRIR